MDETSRVRIFDTTLRDGEQTAGVAFDERDKREIARALEALRVDVIEAGFPVSSPAEARAVRAVAEDVRESSVCALARAVQRDVEAAGEAVAHAAAPRIHVFVNASDMHLAHQLRATREKVAGMVAAMVARARELAPDVEFSPMDATRADLGFVLELARAAVGAGARTVNLPDTVGCARPDQVSALVRSVCEAIGETEGAVVSFHGQDDLGLATANALAAVAAGARQVEVAVNGIGERAGNTSLEEVVVALHVHGEALGVHTGVDSSGICEASRLVEERSGIVVPPNKAVVGRNAFRHASGIHQDGVLKHRATYEAYDPALIGHPRGSEIVLGKLSGRAGFAARVEALGLALEGEALGRAFTRFQERVGARGGEVGDAELRELCRGARRREPGYALDL